AFSVEPNKDSVTLEKYLREYPQYREELIDLSIEIFANPNQDFSPVSEGDSKEAELVWERFQSSLTSAATVSGSSSIKNPLLNLDRSRFRALAKKLGVNSLFLTMLRDRTIKVSTIPTQLIEVLAKELDVSSDGMRNALVGEPTVSSSVRFKADGKPTATKQVSFDEALDSCSLSDSQKEKLMEMKD
ncbi:hypothetical protein, partial [Vibrio parahaemolyticus]